MQKLFRLQNFALVTFLSSALWAALDSEAAVRSLTGCQFILLILAFLRAPLELVRPAQGTIQELKVRWSKNLLGGLLLGMLGWTPVAAVDYLSSRVTIEDGVVTDCQKIELADRSGNLRQLTRVALRLGNGHVLTQTQEAAGAYQLGEKLQIKVRRGIFFESIQP